MSSKEKNLAEELVPAIEKEYKVVKVVYWQNYVEQNSVFDNLKGAVDFYIQHQQEGSAYIDGFRFIEEDIWWTRSDIAEHCRLYRANRKNNER